MHHRLTTLFGLAATLLTICAHADESANIPDKARENILKRHPTAHELEATYETHFGQKLIEVSFKEDSDQKSSELFTSKGHLFTNEETLIGLSGVSQDAVAALEKEFPNYMLQKTELIVNPNGVGEEYEIYLHANGSDWKINISQRGVVNEKARLSP
ncbi:MAG: hypothetical protein ACU836_06105 [Gammaproteobacteria bacterium]